MHPISERKFLSLKVRVQHRILAALLKEGYLGQDNTSSKRDDYFRLSALIDIKPVDFCQFKQVATRYHEHAINAGLPRTENHLLPQIETGDKTSSKPFLDIAIYLDNLRSAHNVGSIIRTTEAFRLGELYLSPNTPGKTHPGTVKTAMGAEKMVPIHENHPFGALEQNQKKPIIALETAPNAPSIANFTFPESFTFILGNEELGISEELLKKVDTCLQIPLVGTKNSLNVSNAYAIAASYIRLSFDKESCDQ